MAIAVLRTSHLFYKRLKRFSRPDLWSPHPDYSVFTQYDQENYRPHPKEFLRKYRMFYALSRFVRAKSIVELGCSAGSAADAYLSGSPGAKYLGIDVFGKTKHRVTGKVWDPYRIAQALFRARGYRNWRLWRKDLRSLKRLPGRADWVIVDGAHDYESARKDLELAMTAGPKFILVDDARELSVRSAICEFAVFRKREIRWAALMNTIDGAVLLAMKKPARRPVRRRYRAKRRST